MEVEIIFLKNITFCFNVSFRENLIYFYLEEEKIRITQINDKLYSFLFAMNASRHVCRDIWFIWFSEKNAEYKAEYTPLDTSP